MLPPIRDVQIRYLVSAEFPDAFVPYPTRLEHAVSSKFRNYILAADAKRQELEALPLEYLADLVSHKKTAENADLLRRHRIAAENRRFNRPESIANFDRWAKTSFWSMEEAVALSLGREPASSTWENVRRFAEISAYAAEFSVRLDVFQRAVAAGQLWTKTVPSAALAWAARMDIHFPPELIEAVTKLGKQIADWKTLYDGREEEIASLKQRIQSLEADSHLANVVPTAPSERGLGARERASLLKLVIGMAVGGYGYDPLAARGTTAKEISSDLALKGIGLDEDTVRKYLREAAEMLPSSELDQSS